MREPKRTPVPIPMANAMPNAAYGLRFIFASRPDGNSENMAFARRPNSRPAIGGLPFACVAVGSLGLRCGSASVLSLFMTFVESQHPCRITPRTEQSGTGYALRQRP